jgi:hypothetical protein
MKFQLLVIFFAAAVVADFVVSAIYILEQPSLNGRRPTSVSRRLGFSIPTNARPMQSIYSPNAPPVPRPLPALFPARRSLADVGDGGQEVEQPAADEPLVLYELPDGEVVALVDEQTQEDTESLVPVE